MTVTTDFKARFPPPQFTTLVVDQYIPIFEPLITCYFVGGYEGCDKEITLQLLAHLITQELQATVGGNTGVSGSSLRVESSVSVGSVSQSFEQSANDSEFGKNYSTTRYGQQFLLLTSHISGGCVV